MSLELCVCVSVCERERECVCVCVCEWAVDRSVHVDTCTILDVCAM